MAPNGNGPTASQLYREVLETDDSAKKLTIIARMLAMHLEEYQRFKGEVRITITGIALALGGLGGAIIQHCVG